MGNGGIVKNLLDVLRERGFIQQTTDDEAEGEPLREILETRCVTAYVGFDPTASSFHVGNLVPILGLLHLQRSGHRPIAVVGGGTGMVGDPSGKTEMRKLLGKEEVRGNMEAQKKQLERYIELGPPPAAGETPPPKKADGSGPSGFILDNADWLAPLNYIDFLRDIGSAFSVNRMLQAESAKLRLESPSGLSFLEFNYSILQAYDFLVLNQRYGCELQMGGGDQWGNIVAGTDLIRRIARRRAHGITFPLVMTSSGKKMGKSETGAVWLDPARTSPYDYYQYWVNTDDPDVGRFLRMFTLLPIEEVERLEKLSGSDIREAKRVLAFEATALTHGVEEARKAEAGARSLFGGGDQGGEGASVPAREFSKAALEAGVPLAELAAESGLCESKNAARRLAAQGGLYVNGEPAAEGRAVTLADLKDGGILLRAGKKKYLRITPA